jgi:hypothetical protein
MDCSEAKQLLSAFYDDELPLSQRTAVAEHLARCYDCAREQAGFRRLSAMAAGLAHPEAPAHIWERLEEQLEIDHRNRLERPKFTERLGWAKKPTVRLGLAATVLIAMGWFGYVQWLKHDAHHEMAVVFGQYLTEFDRNPGAAQQMLLARYDGRAIDVEHAVQKVGYRPVIAEGMPEDYVAQTTYVMKMPCCTCVLTHCNRSDGGTIAVFEHDDIDPLWFGDRPKSEANCRGKRCNIVDLGKRLAATWSRGKRQITVVGAEDIKKVEQLVAWFDDRRQSDPE